MKKIFLIVLPLIWGFIFGCKSRFDENAYKYFRQISNDTLKSVIINYVKSTSFDRKSQFVAVYYSRYGPKISYNISAGKTLGGINLFPPDCFSSVDDIIVAFRISGDDLIDLDEVSNEFERFSNEKGVNFESNKVISYDPPTWILNKCEGDYELIKRMSPESQEFLPCDFVLKRQKDFDSLSLTRKPRNKLN